MLETDENVNEDTPEGGVDEAAAEPAAKDEAPDQVAEEVVAPGEPAEEPTAEEVADAPAEEPAEEPAAEEAPPEEAPAAQPAAAAAPVADVEPEEALSPKEARKRTRSLHTDEARPQRSAEERAQERVERRRAKAVQRRAHRQKQRERRAGEPRGEATTAPVEHVASQGTLKVRQGVVVADKADKTITVRIDVARQHRMYKKIVRTSSTLHAHDEQNEAHVGDTVRLIESRPLSRTKRWRLVEVLERAR
jgi:small subunit ribosomal protein S17